MTYPRQAAPRGGVRTWWGKAWQRAVEEAAYSETELKGGRTAARRGEVGGISVDAGALLAAVRDGDDAWTVSVEVPVLDADAARGLVEVVAAESGRIASLLAGDLPHDLVEHAEEVGVELLPYGGELAASCACPHYLDPCPHAIAVLVQVGWLVDGDPLVLFALRGLDREALLAALHARASQDGAGGAGGGSGAGSGAGGGAGGDAGGDRVADLADDVEVAADAVLRARRLIELLDAGPDSDLPDSLL
ncbi:SWIM zinc finger family protein [Nocardioides sp. YIM 152588]|uniref:SWIM zinc finger family protein n=1 Tax=Nocardioides sp. YIM 152588 TaxID=3158259 RepID=UPI0032E46756